MNILLLTNCMSMPDDRETGVPDVVFFFAKEWQKAGHNVVIVKNESKYPALFYIFPNFVYSWLKKKNNISIPSLASRKKLIIERDGIKIARFPMGKLIPHSAFLESQYDKQVDRIKSYLTELNFSPDVITGHWIEPQLKLVSKLGEIYNAKTGFVVHGELPTNFNDEYKSYIRNLNCFFTRSEPVKRKMLTNPNYNYLIPEKTAVCYSGIPDEFLSNLSLRHDWKENSVFHVIYVGRLIRYKRLDSTLKALKQAFPNGGYIFDIVGDGPEKDNWAALANELGISDNVVFHGRVPRTEVIRMMSKADCFVMISENEVFGLVYLEAMACGCITIASKEGGVDGIIVNEENGFLCEQANSDELSNLLKTTNKMDKKSVECMRASAFETVQKFSDSKVAQRYLNDIIARSQNT